MHHDDTGAQAGIPIPRNIMPSSCAFHIHRKMPSLGALRKARLTAVIKLGKRENLRSGLGAKRATKLNNGRS